MRQTIELLRKQSIQAGLTQAHMQSMGVQVNVNGSSAKVVNGSPVKTNGQQEQQHHQQQQQQIHHQQQQLQQQNGNMQRQHSTDSMCSVNSNGSNGSSSQEKKKKKGWVCLDIFMSCLLLKYFYYSICHFSSMYSFEVPSQKLSHVMPKLPRQIAKQIIPIRNHHYLPHHKRIHRQQCMTRMQPLESYRLQKVHIGIFRLWKMPNP